ncbi:NAD(P)/FAD-dependent oxidoreductase [Nocardia rhizosphaerae]|uniref:NAD(P)/FAD-dependent oxidoreductase n=1 Tax=Nocardia rhizosphaerae TaxID=1691571 RepID=A0ABV8L904_9NOCA
MNASNRAGPRRVAVIGSGVAGLTAAWVLARTAEVTLYEAQGRLGGHADTHRVDLGDGASLGVDTGFIVHNDRTYPTLLRLFGELGIATGETDMSMSVRCDGCGLEYAGARGLPGLFPRAGQLTRGRYLRLLAEVPRFHRLAEAELRAESDSGRTVAEFLAEAGFSTYFRTHFLTPLISAVWSCDPGTALRYPARYLFTFLEHHGMLTVFGSPTWRTVTGGSATYVAAVAARLHRVRVATPVRALHRHEDRVTVRTADDGIEDFDAAVIAAHPHQALALLAEPTAAERDILAAMPYSVNHTVLHTDSRLLPRAPGARASWNYRLPACAAEPDRVLVTYDLTRLQRLPEPGGRRFLVTLGDGDRVAPDTVLDSMVYEHPRYTPESVAARARTGELGCARTAFAGAYHGWGFHEDGALSGLRAAERLGARWTGRIPAPRVTI